MFVGIICACIPAAAHTCHHHLPSYDSLKKNLQTRYLSSRVKGRRKDPSFPEKTSHGVKTSRSVHERYVDLEAPELPMPVPAKSLMTLIHRASSDDLDLDGIYLAYKMQQTSTLPPTSTDHRTAV